MEELREIEKRLENGSREKRKDNELMKIDRIIGMGEEIDDVNNRKGKKMRIGEEKIEIKRKEDGLRRRIGKRKGKEENRIGEEVEIVGREIKIDKSMVDEKMDIRVNEWNGVENIEIE